jgi:hypothetical protein
MSNWRDIEASDFLAALSVGAFVLMLALVLPS